MNKRQEVPRRLLVPCRHPAKLLDQVDEPLHLVPFLVQMLIIVARHHPVLLGRDDRLGPARRDRPHQRVAVVRLVRDHRPGVWTRDQRLGLAHIGVLARRQNQPCRVAQGVDGDGDLGRPAAPTPPECLLCLAPATRFFWGAPAACWWARTTVESRINHSRSGSWRASKTRSHTPFWAQRSNRRQTEFQGPNRAGRSRHGAPVWAIQRTASRTRRLSWAALPCWPHWPGRRSLIRSQSASWIAWRWCMTDSPWRVVRPVSYQNCPALFHTP